MKKAGMKYAYGGSAKAAKRYAKYGKEFKDIPAGKEGAGLRALSKSVRNNMGYAKRGKEYGHGGMMAMDPRKKTMFRGVPVPGMYNV